MISLLNCCFYCKNEHLWEQYFLLLKKQNHNVLYGFTFYQGTKNLPSSSVILVFSYGYPKLCVIIILVKTKMLNVTIHNRSLKHKKIFSCSYQNIFFFSYLSITFLRDFMLQWKSWHHRKLKSNKNKSFHFNSTQLLYFKTS